MARAAGDSPHLRFAVGGRRCCRQRRRARLGGRARCSRTTRSRLEDGRVPRSSRVETAFPSSRAQRDVAQSGSRSRSRQDPRSADALRARPDQWSARGDPDHLGRKLKGSACPRPHGTSRAGDMKRLKMGAILAVDRNSRNEPAPDRAHHRPRRPASRVERRASLSAGHHLRLGGGLSLKPPASMEIQEARHGRRAAVLGAMQAIAALKAEHGAQLRRVGGDHARRARVPIRATCARSPARPSGAQYRRGRAVSFWPARSGWAAAGGRTPSRRVLKDGRSPLTLTGAVTTAWSDDRPASWAARAELVPPSSRSAKRPASRSAGAAASVDEIRVGHGQPVADIRTSATAPPARSTTCSGAFSARDSPAGRCRGRCLGIPQRVRVTLDQNRPCVPRGAVG